MNLEQAIGRWRPYLLDTERDDWDKLSREQQHSGFTGKLVFGTAGIRARMQWGPGGINRITVARTARGIGQALLAFEQTGSCAIAYDSRHGSEAFARLCARVLAEEGIAVFLFDRPAPTPMLSFAVRHLGCGAGIVISASHNPKDDNGLKCYGPDGAQIGKEEATEILTRIAQLPEFCLPKLSLEAALEAGKVQWIGQSLWQSYYEAVFSELWEPEAPREAQLRVVYTPLCGTGGEPVGYVLQKLGVAVAVPEAQAAPDGDFATCPSPNPEEDVAFREALQLAEREEPDLVLATDPDCDRLAITVQENGRWRRLSGDELGCLLLDYLLTRGKELGKLPARPEVVMSLVSTPMAGVIGAAGECRVVEVPTGFKYIGQRIRQLEEAGRGEEFLFGFEESCGFLKGSFVRDKDGVLAAALVCQMAACWKLRSMDLAQRLQGLYECFGCCRTRQKSIRFSTPQEQARWQSVLKNLGQYPPERLGDLPLERAANYESGLQFWPGSDRQAPTCQPHHNMVGLWSKDGGRILLRPSGTEPKMKIYYAAWGTDPESARQALDRLVLALEAYLQKMEEEQP